MMATEGKSKKRRAGQDERAGPRKKQKGPLREDESLLDAEAGLNKGIAFMDTQLLADHLAQKTTRFGTDLTPIELSDLYISANAIRDSTSWQRERTLENLPDFLEDCAGTAARLGVAPKQNGSPHTIVVAGAGLRAADIVRALRKFQGKDNTVAKLFAKHIKMKEAVSFLQMRRTGIGVGTPIRLLDLLENGALSVKSLRRIVIDASHIDQKKRGIMDMKETALPLAKLLARKEFKDRYTDPDQHLDLIFY